MRFGEGRQDGDEMGQERRREIRKERRRGRGEDAAVSVGRSEVRISRTNWKLIAP
jgi:hypothetical protein